MLPRSLRVALSFSFFACGFCACGAAATLPPAAVAHNQAGAASLAEGELDDAEARFRLALEYHPGFPESRANLGLVAFRRGRLDEAEGHFRAAIRLDRSFEEAWSNLGLVLVAKGQIGDAISAFEEALAIDPGFVHARHNLAELLMRHDRFVAARAHLLRLVQIEAEDTAGGARASALLAYCEYRLGRLDEAFFRAQNVLAIQPDEPFARLVRGVAWAADGDYTQALADYEVAASVPSLRHDVQVRIAAVHIARQDIEAARPVVRTLLEQSSEDAATQLLGAHLAVLEGDVVMARRHASEALRLAPELAAAEVILANLPGA